jgi:hypothetical protein
MSDALKDALSFTDALQQRLQNARDELATVQAEVLPLIDCRFPSQAAAALRYSASIAQMIKQLDEFHGCLNNPVIISPQAQVIDGARH